MGKQIFKTLIVGLGGTGQTVIRDIKKHLLEKYDEIPPMVKFLAFDCAERDYVDDAFRYSINGERRETKQFNLEISEFCQLTLPDVEVLREDPNCQNLNYQQLATAYQKTSGHETMGQRVLGRAYLLSNAGLVIHTLQNVVEMLNRIEVNSATESDTAYFVPDTHLQVYIVASLAGGFGSSAILDMNRMVQLAGVDLHTITVDGYVHQISGLFFLPSFFSTKPHTLNARINAYVALSELDHTLNLNDRGQYPIGCVELENDFNEYAGIKDYKKVEYRDVFLVDSETMNGRRLSLQEASGIMAAYIVEAVSTLANAERTVGTTATHYRHNVDGKKQYYEGVGYAEMRFDRQNLANYLLNKRLATLMDQYYFDDTTRLYDVVNTFIYDNRLDEGWRDVSTGWDDRAEINQLTDSIFGIYDSRFSIDSIDMLMPQPGLNAAGQIVENKQDYMEALQIKIKACIREFEIVKEGELVNSLIALLEERQVDRGFSRFPELAKYLSRSLARMKEGLEEEIAYCRGRLHELEEGLDRLVSMISENSDRGFLGIGNRLEKQNQLIGLYHSLVVGHGSDQEPTLARLTLELGRKEKAIAVYEKLLNIVKDYYEEKSIETAGGEMMLQVSGKSVEIRNRFELLRLAVEKEIEHFKFPSGANTMTVFADNCFKNYFDVHPQVPFESFDFFHQETWDAHLKEVLLEGSIDEVNNLSAMRDVLLQLLPDSSLVVQIQNGIDICELLVRCFGNFAEVEDSNDFDRYPQLGLFDQLQKLLEPLWSWKQFFDMHAMSVSQWNYVGYYGIDDFHDSVYKDLGLDCFLHNTLFHARTTDHDRLLFTIHEMAIPAFKLKDAVDWAREYNKADGSFYAFSDVRLEQIDMIVPDSEYIKGDIAWAYGWMFGLISSADHKIQVKPTDEFMIINGGKKSDSGYFNYFNAHVRVPSDLAACHKRFIRDEELSSDIYDQVLALLEADPRGSIDKLFHWVNEGRMWENRGKQMESMSDEERWVVQKEVSFLARLFDRLNSPELKISLDENTGKIITQ